MSAEWVRRDFRGRHTAWPAATRLALEETDDEEIGENDGLATSG